MRKYSYLLIGFLILGSILFTFVPHAQAEPDNNPIFATLDKVRLLIEEAFIGLENRIGLVEDRVENLEVWAGDPITEPNCATCTATIKDTIVRVENEEEAINSLRSIFFAQDLFAKEDNNKNGQFDYAPQLGQLFQNGRLIDNVLATGERRGYTFELSQKPQGIGWELIARPKRSGGINRTGDRTFYVDESGVIRFESSPSATPNNDSQPIGG